MQQPDLPASFRTLQERISGFEQRLTDRSNALTFLVIRFLLMSALVVGFTWYALELSP